MDFASKPLTNLHMISEKVDSPEESHFNSKSFMVPAEGDTIGKTDE